MCVCAKRICVLQECKSASDESFMVDSCKLVRALFVGGASMLLIVDR